MIMVATPSQGNLIDLAIVVEDHMYVLGHYHARKLILPHQDLAFQ